MNTMPMPADRYFDQRSDPPVSLSFCRRCKHCAICLTRSNTEAWDYLLSQYANQVAARTGNGSPLLRDFGPAEMELEAACVCRQESRQVRLEVYNARHANRQG